MIDYKVGDVVIGISDVLGTGLVDNLFIIKKIYIEGEHEFVYIEGITKKVQESFGYYSHRFKKYDSSVEPDCRFCTSQCKADKPCPFYVGI